jgi:hypothetical protein
MDVPGNIEKFVDPTGSVRKTYEEAVSKPAKDKTEKDDDKPETDGTS